MARSPKLWPTRLNRPFLWLQSVGPQPASYVQVRDRLMGGLRQGGDVLTVGGSIHQSFTDDQSRFSAAGRGLLGDGAGPNAVDDITSMTHDVIAAFVGPYLDGPTSPAFGQAVADHPSIWPEQHVASTMTG
jgi:hypothetical protein